MDLKTLRTDRMARSTGVLLFSEQVSPTPVPNCLVAHDDAELVKQATLVLRRFCWVNRVEAVYSAREAEEWASVEEWGLIVFGERLAMREPDQAVERLRQRAPRAVILVLGESDDQDRAFDLVRAGADYYGGYSGLASAEFPLVIQRLLEARTLRLDQERTRLYLECLGGLLDEPILEIDAMGHLRHASRSLAMRAGFLLSDLRGGPFAGLIQPSDVDRWQHWLNTAQRGTAASHRLSVHLRQGRRGAPVGTAEGLAVEIAPVHGSNGRFLGAAGVVRETTDANLSPGAIRGITDLLESAAGLCSALMTYAATARRELCTAAVAPGESLYQVEGVLRTVADLVERLRSRDDTGRGTQGAWRRSGESG